MKFISVNGQSPPATFDEVIIRSIAPDGGLYVPERIPRFPSSLLDNLAGQSLQNIGLQVASLFLENIPRETLANVAARTWNFPIPLVPLESNLFLLELFHGPTLAFKDVGARFMAEILSVLPRNRNEHVTILVATSGDTGSAVAHGFFNTPHIDVYILYPSGKISRLQEQQMTTLGGNIHPLEVDGTFDDCQQLVKQALVDPDIQRSHLVTSANSINLARLLPQVIYHVWGIAQWQNRFLKAGEEPFVVVPSGNFGNMTAAAYARRMGTPIGKFIAVTNSNDIVPRFFLSGKFDPRPAQQTLSNAMDVGNPSNFPRLQFLYGNNLAAMQRDIETASITDAETVEEIRQTYERTGTILDPHTAVGVAAARRLSHSRPTIIAATAHPAKFPEVIHKALGIDLPLPPTLASALERPKQSRKMSNNYEELKSELLR